MKRKENGIDIHFQDFLVTKDNQFDLIRNNLKVKLFSRINEVFIFYTNPLFHKKVLCSQERS